MYAGGFYSFGDESGMAMCNVDMAWHASMSVQATVV